MVLLFVSSFDHLCRLLLRGVVCCRLNLELLHSGRLILRLVKLLLKELVPGARHLFVLGLRLLMVVYLFGLHLL